MTYERTLGGGAKAERKRRAGQFDGHITCDGCKTGGIGGFCATQGDLEAKWVEQGGLAKDGLHFHAECRAPLKALSFILDDSVVVPCFNCDGNKWTTDGPEDPTPRPCEACA